MPILLADINHGDPPLELRGLLAVGPFGRMSIGVGLSVGGAESSVPSVPDAARAHPSRSHRRSISMVSRRDTDKALAPSTR
jgi:hypothetical protein